MPKNQAISGGKFGLKKPFGKQGPNACIIGNRVPAKGHRWIATFKRGSFLLYSLTADEIQPRLCCLKRHRLLAREAELGAILPHPVEHHADAPSQRNGRSLLTAQLRQT